MPGKRLKLDRLDNEVLKCFFLDKEYSRTQPNYFKLNEYAMSTKDIKDRVGAHHLNRTIKRLEKLRDFGLIRELREKDDSKWYITHEGMYYILATMNGYSKIRKFVKTNYEVSHFVIIQKLIEKGETQHVLTLIKEIRDCIRIHMYKKITKIVRDWFNLICEDYIDWHDQLLPGQRYYKWNHKTKENEIF